MPAKLTFISIVHSVIERDSSNYTIRDAIVVVRNENNTTMDIKLTAFTPKENSVPRWVPLFEPGNVLRFTGKFALDDELPHNTLEVKKILLLLFLFFKKMRIFFLIIINLGNGKCG